MITQYTQSLSIGRKSLGLQDTPEAILEYPTPMHHYPKETV